MGVDPTRIVNSWDRAALPGLDSRARRTGGAVSGGGGRAGYGPETTVALGDGRSIEVLTAGPAHGLAVVFHHGTPFAAVPYEPSAEQVWDRGVRLVSWARPGYAGSPPLPGRRVAHAAADTAAVLDALGHDRFVTIGWSGGGPHALACAALLPGRCAGVATIAGVAPHDAEGLDWLAGMGPENIEEFGAAAGDGSEIVDFLTREAHGLRTITGADVAASLGGLVTDIDKAALTGGFADYVARGMRAATQGGIDGWLDDDRAFTADWGFDLSARGRARGHLAGPPGPHGPLRPRALAGRPCARSGLPPLRRRGPHLVGGGRSTAASSTTSWPWRAPPRANQRAGRGARRRQPALGWRRTTTRERSGWSGSRWTSGAVAPGRIPAAVHHDGGFLDASVDEVAQPDHGHAQHVGRSHVARDRGRRGPASASSTSVASSQAIHCSSVQASGSAGGSSIGTPPALVHHLPRYRRAGRGSADGVRALASGADGPGQQPLTPGSGTPGVSAAGRVRRRPRRRRGGATPFQPDATRRVAARPAGRRAAGRVGLLHLDPPGAHLDAHAHALHVHLVHGPGGRPALEDTPRTPRVPVSAASTART